MNYYVGLDNGGTTTKAAIFDAKGKEIATASTATKMLVPQPGFTERDMEEMWEANCLVIREALKKSGAAPADIRCVAVCGHGKGLYLWGKDGRPAYHGIISTDNRAWRYMEAWRRTVRRKRHFSFPASTCWPASRWRCSPGCGITVLRFWKIPSGFLNVRITSGSA